MQPPNPEEIEGKVSNANINLNIKKGRGCVKKEKVAVKRDTVTPNETEVKTTKSEPAIVLTTSSHLVLKTTRSPGPYRGKCLYQSRKCENERATKRNGKPHNLCDEHRFKQNQHQRKFDAKKFLRKRQRDSLSDEDANIDGDKLQSYLNDEPIVKRHRVMANQEATTGTSTVMTNSEFTRLRGNYPPVYAAGSRLMSTPMTSLPPVENPRGSILPTSPEVLYGSVRPGVIPVAYIRDHMGISDYRSRAGGQQSSRISHRPNLQQQVTQRSTGYTHSELVAASILTQPRPYPLCAALSTPASHKNEVFAAGSSRGSMITPRMLPSLRVPPSAALSSSPYHRVSGILSSSAQPFASVVVNPAASVSFYSARSEGKALPSLMSFGRRKPPASPFSVSKHRSK